MNESADWFREVIAGGRGLRGAIWRANLWWARLPYGVGVAVRNFAYDRGWKKAHRADVPVVSVGNLTLGGTGKTPCVEWVARFYLERGIVAPILSRGYGSADGLNDEALVLEENVGVAHLQGADRVELARTAVEELEPDVLILDDGFQHRRLARDLDIVLIDATSMGEYLFPRGTLREGWSSLARADAVILTRADQATENDLDSITRTVRRHNPDVAMATAAHLPIELRTVNRIGSVDALQGRKVGAFCGVGNPDSFRRTLMGLGAEVIDFRTFMDHHPYPRETIDELKRWAAALPDGAWVVTTQKDFVKIRATDLGGKPLWAVRVGMAFLDGQDALEALLLDVAGDSPPAPE